MNGVLTVVRYFSTLSQCTLFQHLMLTRHPYTVGEQVLLLASSKGKSSIWCDLKMFRSVLYHLKEYPGTSVFFTLLSMVLHFMVSPWLHLSSHFKIFNSLPFLTLEPNNLFVFLTWLKVKLQITTFVSCFLSIQRANKTGYY